MAGSRIMSRNTVTDVNVIAVAVAAACLLS